MKNANNSQKIRRMVVIAMFAAMAYVAMLVIHIKVSFLTLDVKDAVITLCGLYFGPLSALFISVLVPVIEFATVSDTGLYGLIMNVLGSVSFSVTASLIYKWKKSFSGAILALTSAAFVLTGVMMLGNLVVTPYFMGVDIATVRGMIPTLLLPFNLLKAIINVGVVLLLYKHLSTALRKAGFLPRRSFSHASAEEQGTVVAKPSRWRIIGVSVAAVLLITGSLLIIFLVLGGNVGFGK
jgi:riboflavin transporter FmnP